MTMTTTPMRMTTTETRAELSPGPAAPSADVIFNELESLRGRRVAVAMSGGVDSSLAAARLVAHGADVIGLALRLHDPEPHNPLAPRACCAPDDLQDARRVAEHLGVPFYVIDARDRFEEGVVKPFVDSYLAGRTPNPCVGCNSTVKLDVLARRARALGADRLATGHYARTRRTTDGVELFRGHDLGKDQSYYLFSTDPALLRDLVLPLGAMSKAEVRTEALAAGLPVAHKLDSQEVCFVGGAGAGAYVRTRPEAAQPAPGPIVDASGAILGEHEGVAGFTIGQRRGLGIGRHERLFVLNIDAERRAVTVGPSEALMKDSLVARDVAWISGAPNGPVPVVAKIRSRDPGTEAVVEAADDQRVRVRFARPVRAVTPGQAVVFYQGDQVLGGAWIEGAPW